MVKSSDSEKPSSCLIIEQHIIERHWRLLPIESVIVIECTGCHPQIDELVDIYSFISVNVGLTWRAGERAGDKLRGWMGTSMG